MKNTAPKSLRHSLGGVCGPPKSLRHSLGGAEGGNFRCTPPPHSVSDPRPLKSQVRREEPKVQRRFYDHITQ